MTWFTTWWAGLTLLQQSFAAVAIPATVLLLLQTVLLLFGLGGHDADHGECDHDFDHDLDHDLDHDFDHDFDHDPDLDHGADGAVCTADHDFADDEGDDIISEWQLYDHLCALVQRMDADGMPGEDEARRLIDAVIGDHTGPDPGARRRLTLALLTMVYAYGSGKLKQEADLYFEQMEAGGV